MTQTTNYTIALAIQPTSLLFDNKLWEKRGLGYIVLYRIRDMHEVSRIRCLKTLNGRVLVSKNPTGKGKKPVPADSLKR